MKSANLKSLRVAILLFVPLSLLLAASSLPASAETITAVYTFEQPEIRDITIDGVRYQQVIMTGAPNSGAPGYPLLPARGANVLLPPDASVSRVEVIPEGKVNLGGGFSIIPGGHPYKLSAGPDALEPLVPDPAVYASAAPFPGAAYEKIGVHGFRGYQILTLKLQPVEYVPISGELSYFPRITVIVHTAETGRHNALYRGLPADRQILQAKVDNPDLLTRYNPLPLNPAANYDLLILTTSALASAFQPLKDYHDTTGVLTEIHTITEVGSSDPTAVRNYIHDQYTNNGIQYVLIGGDDDLIPAVNLYVASWSGSGAEIEYVMPGDIYFGCLDGTYNYDGDSRWGEPTDGDGGGDVDLVAEVFIGRAPVGNVTEANRFVSKTIEYLTTEDAYLYNVLMCGEYLGFGGVSDYGGNLMDQIVDGSSDDGYTTVGIPSDQYGIDRLYDRDWPGNDWPASELHTRVNDGLHIINHLGHGNTSWALKMASDDIPTSFTNTDFCFLYSQACYSGHFDDADCWAEYMNIKTDYGSWAVVMNARYGWGTSYSTDGPSQRFNREFWDAVFNPVEGKPEIGRANHDSKEDNLYRIGEDCMRWCYYEITLFGDPTVGIRGASGISFSYPQGIPETVPPNETATFEVTVNEYGDGALVSGSAQLHYSINGGPLQTEALTEITTLEFEAVLPALTCAQQIEFYVSAEEAAAGRMYDPDPATPHKAFPVTGELLVFEDDFETDKGWIVSGGQWGRGTPTGGGGAYGYPDPTAAHSGVYAYGYNLAGDYTSDMPEYHVTSPAIDCSARNNVHVKFWRWLGVESPSYDHASVRVSTDGSTWTTVWQNGSEITDNAWTECNVNISAVADNQSVVYLRWTMGTTDGGWEYCGWNIDDIHVVAAECNDSGDDSDNDGVPNGTDNCPFVANPAQEDVDTDGIGDVCDNCPSVTNPFQEDADNDEIGDVCDECTDTDGDGLGDPGFAANTCALDNCPGTANPGQEDDDQDGLGNVCDDCDCTFLGDCNGDQVITPIDVALMVAYVYKSQGSPPPAIARCPEINGDWDCNDLINPVDVIRMVNHVYRPPADGPCNQCAQ